MEGVGELTSFVDLVLYAGVAVAAVVAVIAFLGWRRAQNLTRLPE